MMKNAIMSVVLAAMALGPASVSAQVSTWRFQIAVTFNDFATGPLASLAESDVITLEVRIDASVPPGPGSICCDWSPESGAATVARLVDASQADILGLGSVGVSLRDNQHSGENLSDSFNIFIADFDAEYEFSVQGSTSTPSPPVTFVDNQLDQPDGPIDLSPFGTGSFFLSRQPDFSDPTGMTEFLSGQLVAAEVLGQPNSEPAPSSFTYQGRLESFGVPVTSPVDLRFTLWDTPADGTRLTPNFETTLTPDDGVFSISLPFADALSTRQSRYLEIEIASPPGSAFAPLGRQLIEATPYAIGTKGIESISDASLAIGPPTAEQSGAIGDVMEFRVRSNEDGRSDIVLQTSGQDTGFRISYDDFAGSRGLQVADLFSGRIRLFVEAVTGFIGIGTFDPMAAVDVRFDDSNGLEISDLSPSTSSLGVASTVGLGTAIRGVATSPSGANYGVYGESLSPSGWGVFSNGRLGATGTKSFMIDHPLDPENRVLLHYSTETPEPQNRYNGNVRLDAAGTAIVQLPPYFQAINSDFRYTLTSIGAPAPNLHIASEIRGNRFEIAGGQAGQKVTWEVIATRSDLFVTERGAPAEIIKQGQERGRYLAPGLYGLPSERGLNHAPAHLRSK